MSSTNVPLDDNPPAVSTRCNATTKRGGVCPNVAAPGRLFCLLHDPERAEERRRLLSERGRAGQAKRVARERAAREVAAAQVSLQCTADIRAALERALAAVEASGVDPVARGNVTARIATAALSILRLSDLEHEVAALREALIERHPELRSRLEGFQ